jgi:diguanylate cyclase (GGDEF)-like protein
MIPEGEFSQYLIKSITADNNGHLWLAAQGLGVIEYDPESKRVLTTYKLSEDEIELDEISSIEYDSINNKIWVLSDEGIFFIDIEKRRLYSIKTEFDGLYSTFVGRDISFDESRNLVWIGTRYGLLKIDTVTLEQKVYTANRKANSAPTNDATTTFVDSANNTWVGFEKSGICAFQHSTESFLCMPPAVDQDLKMPFSTIEDIYEDPEGSLWVSVNNFGIVRITPSHEKFQQLDKLITNGTNNYFPNTFEGVVVDESHVWIATDGGGINIFNFDTGELTSLRHDPNDATTITSDSIISLAKDENEDIWASTWGGGLMRIDPRTLAVEPFLHDPLASESQTIAGNNVFNIEPDLNGGVWISVWEEGVQYYDFETKSFSNYFGVSKGSDSGLKNVEIMGMQLFQNKLYVAGEAGLEVMDLGKRKFSSVVEPRGTVFNYVLVASDDEIWIATQDGLYLTNPVLGTEKVFYMKDGLSANDTTYLYKDRQNVLWIASVNGLTAYNIDKNTFERFYEKDGLASNTMGNHGEFFEVGNKLYVPGKYGLSIIDTFDLPKITSVSRTMLNDIILLGDNADTYKASAAEGRLRQLPYNQNSLRFHFTSSNLIYPEENRFKYRLIGWQNDFVETDANERFAGYTNLPAGDYRFEVFSSNGSEAWDEIGDSYSFTILSPWYATWWAYLFYTLLTSMSVYIFSQWRLSIIKGRGRELENKVQEKTVQLAEYAADLEKATKALSDLNHELEERVDKRTTELQVEVNERKAAESRLFHQAFHDSLTGLPNRKWITENISGLLERCSSDKHFGFGVMFLDGDRFKHINDTHGHTFGDKLLLETKNRLTSILGDKQYVGRLGGDEFTVITENQSQEELLALAKRIIQEFEQPFYIQGNTVHFNVSIGVLECDQRFTTVAEVLRSADIAMYRAKAAGRGTFKLFDEKMQQEIFESSELEQGLREAIAGDQLSLVYQPLIDLNSGTIEGFEALLRWDHPTKGTIPPFVFIPIAEETGMIWSIGEWVLKEACKQTKQWHDLKPELGLSISVNLSTHQLRSSEFLSCIDDILEETQLDSRYLKLEITESVLIENNHQLNVLYEQLRERNIDLAIDDFGTGYSSLAYLAEIPVQYLKVDRKFVSAIDGNTGKDINQDALELLRSTVSLGKSLRKKITAEGIETRTQLGYLIASGCDLAQGYLLSRPLSPENATNAIMNPKPFEEGGTQISKANFASAYKLREKYQWEQEDPHIIADLIAN